MDSRAWQHGDVLLLAEVAGPGELTGDDVDDGGGGGAAAS